MIILKFTSRRIWTGQENMDHGSSYLQVLISTLQCLMYWSSSLSAHYQTLFSGHGLHPQSVYWFDWSPGALTTCEGLFWLSLGPQSTDHIPGPVKAILIAPSPGREGRGSKTHTRDNQDQADGMWATGDPGSNSHREITFIQTEGSMMLEWLGVMISLCINRDYWWGVMHIEYRLSWRFWMFC